MKQLALFVIFFGILTQVKAFEKVNISTFNAVVSSGILDYDIIHYDFHLNVETGSRAIQGYVKITARSLKNDLNGFEFQLHDNFTIDSVIYKGQKISFGKIANHRKMAMLSDATAENDIFDLKIYYSGNAPLSSNDWGNGIVQKKENKYNADVFYTLSVPYHAYEWFPCKQVLSDLIDSVSLTIITKKENSVISNGLPVADLDLLNGKHAVTWKTSYPINYYLISFNVGKYIPYHFDVSLPGKTDAKMPVMNFLYNQASLTKEKPVLDQLGNFLTNYSKLFGLYPFHKEKFGTVVVPLSGGMEHQTMVNLSTDYDKYLAAHEMSHQWWGDNVSLKSYHDVWLNEGWASYCEYLTAEKLFPAEAKNILDNFHNGALSQAAGRTYIADTSSFNTIYDYNNVYMKGAAIAHTLRAEIANDSIFFESLAKYQRAFSHKSVTATDFKEFLEKETGKDLTLFFNQWYYGYGYPKFAISWANNNNKLIIKSVQTTSSANTPLFKTNLEFTVKRKNLQDTLVVVYQFSNEQTFILSGFSDVTAIVLDPRNVIINKLLSNKMDPQLTGSGETGIPDNAVTIFPNPAIDDLHIHTKIDGEWKAEIYGENGELLFQQKSAEQELSVPLHIFSHRAVIVKITDEHSKMWSKTIMLH